ncbi:MAG: hypothetical protein ACRDZP_02615 [Acidimicrobiales bacterium]
MTIIAWVHHAHVIRSGSVTETSSAGAPVVLVSVEPALLDSVLSHLLTQRGWHVARPTDAGDEAQCVTAVVLSQDTVVDIEPAAPEVTVILPDGFGNGGSVTRRGEGLVSTARIPSLAALLEVLPAVARHERGELSA